jgi:hypothetical protein
VEGSTRVLHDFLPEYLGRLQFVLGLSEYGTAKPWVGSPTVALQRAVIMMQKLNLYGIPRDIRKGLREEEDRGNGQADTTHSESVEPILRPFSPSALLPEMDTALP